MLHQQRPSSSSFPPELRWLSTRIRPLLWWHLASFLCITAGSLLSILTPLVLRWLIDGIIPHHSLSLLLVAVGLIFLGHQGRTSLMSFGTLLMLSAAQKMSLALRLDLFRHLNELSADYFENTPVGVAMYLFKDPVDEIAYFGSDLLPALLRMLLTTCFTMTAMLILSPALTLAVLPLVPLFLLTRQRFRQRLAANADVVQADWMRWSGFLEEHLASAVSIQLLGQEKRQERRAFRLLRYAFRSQKGLFATSAWYTLWSSLAVVLATCAVMAYGGVKVLAGTLSLGGLVAFYGLATQLFDPLSGAAELYARAQKAFASIRRVQAALALRPSLAQAKTPIPTLHRCPDIDLVGVEFIYPGHKSSLRIPALQIPSGEKIGIAGENGAGKSTLVKLIARVCDPVRGSVHLGGEDVRNFELRSLRRRVCYLPRDPVLFEGTLASNLRFVRPAAGDDVFHELMQEVGLVGLVAGLPDGLHQRIGPGGCQLSGGQRQRLALARALLLEPPILILDEATSCLDSSSELLVLENIRKRLSKSTLIVVSHRPVTLSSCARVLILSGGRIVEDGTPVSLTHAVCHLSTAGSL